MDDDREARMQASLNKAETKAKSHGTNNPNPQTVTGALQAFTSGVRSGTESAVGFAGDAPELLGKGAGWVADKLHGDRDTVSKVVTEAASSPIHQVISALRGMGVLGDKTAETAQHVMQPTTEDVQGATNFAASKLPHDVGQGLHDWTRHQPQGGVEEALFTTGAFVPAAVAPGGIVQRGVRVLAPALASEGGGRVTRALLPDNPNAENAVRFLAALVAGGGAAALEGKGNLTSALKTVNTTPEAADKLRLLLRQSGQSEAEAAENMRALGVNSTPADVAPTATTEAMRIQAEGGTGKGILDPFFRNREADKNARLSGPGGDVTQTVGPRQQPADILAALHDRKETIGQQYPSAKSNQSAPADFQPIADALDAEIATSRGGMKSSLQKVRDMLDDPGAKGNLDPSAEGAHAMRVELDNMLGEAKPGTPLYARLTEIRKQIDAELKGIAPDIKSLDEQYSQASKEGRAFEAGQEIYENPRGNPTEVDFKKTWDTLTPGEKEHLAAGQNVETYRLLGIHGNDLVELQKMLRGPWNQSKLETVIGPDKTRQLMDAIQREKVFNETYRRVVQGSKTGEVVSGGEKGPSIGASLGDAAVDVGVGSLAGPAGMKVAAVNSLRRYLTELIQSKRGGKDKAGGDMAKLLTITDPAQLEAVGGALKAGEASMPSKMSRSALAAILAQPSMVRGRQ